MTGSSSSTSIPPKPRLIAVKGANPSGGLGCTGTIDWILETIPAQATVTAQGQPAVSGNVVTLYLWRPTLKLYFSDGHKAWTETLTPEGINFNR